MTSILKFFFLGVILLVFSFSYRSTHPAAVGAAVIFFKTESKLFAKSASELENAIQLIDNKKPTTITNAREALKKCRLHFKKIEFFLTYFFPDASLVYNAPAKFEVEEPGLEYREPVCLQVIETLLFDENVKSKKIGLLQQAEVIVSSAEDLNSLLYKFEADDKQLLESIRLEIVRIIALNISGYDAPLLKTGIAESFVSLKSIEYCLIAFKGYDSTELDRVSYYLKSSLRNLEESTDFDSFDRLAFLVNHALPLQQHLNKFIVDSKLQVKSSPLNYEAENLFSANAIMQNSFKSEYGATTENIVQLGRKLFSEKHFPVIIRGVV